MSVRFPMHIGMKYSKVGVKNIITDCQEKKDNGMNHKLFVDFRSSVLRSQSE